MNLSKAITIHNNLATQHVGHFAIYMTDRIPHAMDAMPEVEYPDIYINILSLYTKEDLKTYKY